MSFNPKNAPRRYAAAENFPAIPQTCYRTMPIPGDSAGFPHLLLSVVEHAGGAFGHSFQEYPMKDQTTSARSFRRYRTVRPLTHVRRESVGQNGSGGRS